MQIFVEFDVTVNQSSVFFGCELCLSWCGATHAKTGFLVEFGGCIVGTEPGVGCRFSSSLTNVLLLLCVEVEGREWRSLGLSNVSEQQQESPRRGPQV